MSYARWGVVALIAISYVVIGHRYAGYWRADRLLWPYAASLTPLNPVPVVNAYVVAHRR